MRGMSVKLHEEDVRLPRADVRFPVELRPPPGMRVEDPETWPRVQGRVELVGGRLLFMPPCGDVQQDVAADVVLVLGTWCAARAAFVVGGNEAGMLLGGEVRGADAAIWRRSDLGPRTGGFRRVPPVLAVEVTGQDEGEAELGQKARWYLEHGVTLVWIVLPESREVLVIEAAGESRHGWGAELPPCAELPGLHPGVEELFRQIGPA